MVKSVDRCEVQLQRRVLVCAGHGQAELQVVRLWSLHSMWKEIALPGNHLSCCTNHGQPRSDAASIHCVGRMMGCCFVYQMRH